MMYWSLNGTQLHQGHVIDVLRSLATGSVQLVVTSPPYWGLRNYQLPPVEWEPVTFTPVAGLPEMRVAGCEAVCEHVWGTHQMSKHNDSNRHTMDWKTGGDPAAKILGKRVSQGQWCQRCHGWKGCLGLEPDPWIYVGHLVAVFREMRRVLRDDGVMFLNLGDSYANDTKWGGQSGGKNYTSELGGYQGQRQKRHTALKPKDLIGIPWRVAFALQADGWWLRSDVIWQKPNCMPESVTDRPTKAHEYVFLLAKSKRYFWDADAVRVRTGNEMNPDEYARLCASVSKSRGNLTEGKNAADLNKRGGISHPNGRNIRTVWTIPTASYPGAHFATFPTALVRPMIEAGTSERGVCPECGSSWERVTGGEKYTPPVVEEGARHVDKSRGDKTRKLDGKSEEWKRAQASRTTTGWIPTCSCYGIEMPPKLHLPDLPEDARAPFACGKCEGSGLEPSLPLMPDLETPCRKCKGRGERWGNAVWLKWKAECDEVRRNRLHVLGQIQGLDLPTVPATVLDPFAGSGTTAEVAIGLGRKCILVEQSKAYCDEQIIPRLESPIAVRLI